MPNDRPHEFDKYTGECRICGQATQPEEVHCPDCQWSIGELLDLERAERQQQVLQNQLP